MRYRRLMTLLLEVTVKTGSSTYIGNDVIVTRISGTATTLTMTQG